MEAGVLSGERFMSYDDIRGRTARVAGGLDAVGVGPGASVALMLRNDIPFIEVSSATALLGGRPTPINWHWKADEVGYLLENCGARVLVIHADLLPQVAAGIPDGVEVLVVPTPPELAETYGLRPPTTEVPADRTIYDDWVAAQEPWDGQPRPSPGSMIYTSGTTGRPKGVQRVAPTTDQSTTLMGLVTTVFGLVPGATTVIPAPMYHSAPNAYALISAAMGIPMVLMARFDPAEFLGLIEERSISHVQLVPTMFVRLLQLPEDVRRRHDLSSLQHAVHAAAPCPIETKRQMIEWWGPIIYEYYGCTESSAVTFCNSEDWLAHPGTVGKAIQGAHVRVLRPDGTEATTGESGDVFVGIKGAPDFTYRGDDEKRRSIEREGLITCGDVGYLDEEGFLFLNDRRNDMVISGGVNIYPAEIEAALQALDGVGDVAVFGIPDDEYGEALAAFVQPRPGATIDADDVRDHVRGTLAGYKVPRVVEFRDELPREDSGKIFKRVLRDPFWAGRQRNI